jgi:hypothetical protein
MNALPQKLVLDLILSLFYYIKKYADKTFPC